LNIAVSFDPPHDIGAVATPLLWRGCGSAAIPEAL
jgi:hypothetical protein